LSREVNVKLKVPQGSFASEGVKKKRKQRDGKKRPNKNLGSTGSNSGENDDRRGVLARKEKGIRKNTKEE